MSVQSFSGILCDVLKVSLSASETDLPVLSLSGSIQPYVENTSITVGRCLIPRLNCFISIKSTVQILSMLFKNTFLFGNFVTAGLWSSSASWFVQEIFTFGSLAFAFFYSHLEALVCSNNFRNNSSFHSFSECWIANSVKLFKHLSVTLFVACFSVWIISIT